MGDNGLVKVGRDIERDVLSYLVKSGYMDYFTDMRTRKLQPLDVLRMGYGLEDKFEIKGDDREILKLNGVTSGNSYVSVDHIVNYVVSRD